ncbi:MAG: hypothetical protein ACLFWL_09005 [Candidatus Brocadiia bacterium]
MNGESAANVQVAMKPVFVQLLHSNAYEGPCRVGSPEDLDPKKEKPRGEEQFAQWTKQVENELSDEARVLEPVKLEWTDDWHLSKEEIGKLDRDISKVDLFLIQGGLSQYPAISIGRRYEKPVAMVGTVVPIDVSANLRARGLEGFAPLDYGELNDLISLLRIRKSFQNTKILHAVESEVVPVGVVSTIYDMEDLYNRFGG